MHTLQGRTNQPSLCVCSSLLQTLDPPPIFKTNSRWEGSSKYIQMLTLLSPKMEAGVQERCRMFEAKLLPPLNTKCWHTTTSWGHHKPQLVLRPADSVYKYYHIRYKDTCIIHTTCISKVLRCNIAISFPVYSVLVPRLLAMIKNCVFSVQLALVVGEILVPVILNPCIVKWRLQYKVQGS